MSLEDHWDSWTGALALDGGGDPRTWDLKRLLAAWEVQLQRGAKDEAEWRRTRARLYAPDGGARQRTAGGRTSVPGAAPAPAGGGLQAREAEALLARFAMADAMFGAS